MLDCRFRQEEVRLNLPEPSPNTMKDFLEFFHWVIFVLWVSSSIVESFNAVLRCHHIFNKPVLHIESEGLIEILMTDYYYLWNLFAMRQNILPVPRILTALVVLSCASDDIIAFADINIVFLK